MRGLFNNTAVAYSLKSDSELKRARFLFRLMRSRMLTQLGMIATRIALKLHLPVTSLIKQLVFDHFCGGVTEEDCMAVAQSMYEKKLYAIPDYSVEGKETEEQFDNTLYKMLKIIELCGAKAFFSFAVFKPTGLGRFALYKKISQQTALDPSQKSEWDNVVRRFEKICQKAKDENVPLLIDAEESWIQKACDDLITQMMIQFNTEKAVVFNTLQMYRWDRMAYLKELHKQAKTKGFYVGIKLVRGAYMEKERARAARKKYKSPICTDKAETDENYNIAVRYILDNMDSISLFAGTHNEESTYRIMELIKEKGIAKDDPRIWFGQLYGMSDHISFNLADTGYLTAKYLPFGPVRDVVPYLMRRFEENTSAVSQTSRELSLLSRERRRRKS